MTHTLVLIACGALALCSAAIATAAAWIALNTGKAWALGWMVAGALAAAGFVLIGMALW